MRSQRRISATQLPSSVLLRSPCCRTRRRFSPLAVKVFPCLKGPSSRNTAKVLVQPSLNANSAACSVEVASRQRHPPSGRTAPRSSCPGESPCQLRAPAGHRALRSPTQKVGLVGAWAPTRLSSHAPPERLVRGGSTPTSRNAPLERLVRGGYPPTSRKDAVRLASDFFNPRRIGRNLGLHPVHRPWARAHPEESPWHPGWLHADLPGLA